MAQPILNNLMRWFSLPQRADQGASHSTTKCQQSPDNVAMG